MNRLSGMAGREKEFLFPHVTSGEVRGAWFLASAAISQAFLLGLMASSGKIPPVVFEMFRFLLTF